MQPAPKTEVRQSSIIQVSLYSKVVSPKTTWRHVVLTSSDGRIGIGEYTLDGAAGSSGPPPELDSVAREMAAKLNRAPVAETSLSLLGALPTDSIVRSSVYSACSQALVSLCAEAEGKSVAKYLDAGPIKASVPMYANINRRTDERTSESCASSAMTAVTAGFTAVKIAPFDGVLPEECESTRGRAMVVAGLARLGAIRDAVGPAVEIYIDCHWRFSPSGIASILGELERLGIVWLECPLIESIENIPDLKILRGKAGKRGMRLCGLETSIGVQSYEPYLAGGAYDLIMPDIKHAGGYRAILEIADRAKHFGVATSLHNPSGPIAHMASLQLSAILPGDERLEVQFDESPLFWQVTNPLPPAMGRATSVPTEPGLGISLIA